MKKKNDRGGVEECRGGDEGWGGGWMADDDIDCNRCAHPIIVLFLHFGVITDIEGFFFFSSRRRHTRWPRDWSSDVCSSDLSTTRCRCRSFEGRTFSRMGRA